LILKSKRPLLAEKSGKSQKSGVLEWWSTGVMEYQKNERIKEWNDGILEDWA
jgi:hypothetical protein